MLEARARRPVHALWHYRRHSLRRAQGGGGVGRNAARLLSQQHRQPAHAGRDHAVAWRQGSRVQLVGDRVRQSGHGTHRRIVPAVGDESLRSDQAHGRDDPERRGQGGPELAYRAVALLQSGGRTRERAHRRGSLRCAEQPDAVRGASGGRQAPAPAGVRRRLADAGRHGHARLHSRGRSRARAPGRTRCTQATRWRLHGQPGHRTRLHRAAGCEGVRSRERPAGAVRDRRAARRGHR